MDSNLVPKQTRDCPSNWSLDKPLDRPDMMASNIRPRMWTPVDAYYRPKDRNICLTEHSVYCCLTTESTTGCRQTEQTISQKISNIENNWEKNSIKLRETQMCLIESNERLVCNEIKNYRKKLDSITDCVIKETQRFSTNNWIRSQLKTILDKINAAIDRVELESKRIERQFCAQKQRFNEGLNTNEDLVAIECNPLPKLPDLLDFYKSLIDKIPIELFEKSIGDLKGSKSMEPIREGLVINVSNSRRNVGQSLVSPMASADFAHKDSIVYTSMESNINTDSNKFAKQPKTESKGEKPKLKGSQQLLVDKLKDRFKGMSEIVLIKAMKQTKELLITSGHLNGFNDLKIIDIINAISKQIENTAMVTTSGSKQMSDHSNTDKCGLCCQGFDFEVHAIHAFECKHVLHVFHRQCLEEWAQNNEGCPKCSI